MDAYVALLGTAAAIGFFHTLFGPDHYVPFVAMARVGRWSLRKTLLVTLLCGLGHVGSSVLLGSLGVAGGVILLRLENLESARGELAGWLLLGFGITYFVWGVLQAIRNAPHTHVHAHEDGTVHEHVHRHQGGHLHVHAKNSVSHATADGPGSHAAPRPDSVTPWILFTIFVFGPCEPLIPMLMYPAAQADSGLVALVFGLVTLATMTGSVLFLLWGVSWFSSHSLHRYGHAVAGLSITACGLAVKFGL